MALYDIPNMTDGFDNALIDIAGSVSVFTPMFLLFVFGVVFIGGATSQKRRTGTVDMPMWSVIASLSTLMVSLPLTLASGLIQIQVLGILVALVLMGGIWLFLSRNRNEV